MFYFPQSLTPRDPAVLFTAFTCALCKCNKVAGLDRTRRGSMTVCNLITVKDMILIFGPKMYKTSLIVIK